MADWAMVLLTAIYVIATILICYFNYGATKASREQAAEMRRQYEEENRPYITVELIYERKAFYGLRFFNHGKEPSFKSALERTKNKECIIGIGQHYDLYFGTNKFREAQDKVPLSGKVTYQDVDRTYEEPFSIDFDSYATFFSVNSDAEDLLKEIRAQTRELKAIKNSLCQMSMNKSEPSKDEESTSE